MMIRSTIVVGLLVLGSGTLALAQVAPPGGSPFPGLHGGGPKVTLTTAPLGGDFNYVCRLLNVGKSPLPVSDATIRFFLGSGEEVLTVGTCEGSLAPGQTCSKGTNVHDGHSYYKYNGVEPVKNTDVYCQISFKGDRDSVRGAMAGYSLLSEIVLEAGVTIVPTTVVVEAR